MEGRTVPHDEGLMKERSLEESLVLGSGNRLTTDPNDKTKPLVVRGVIKRDHVNQCIKDGRDFYYIDTGYLGNFPSVGNPSGKKIWHRVVKNENQHSTIKEVPSDRWERLVEQDPRLEWKGWKNHDKKILLVMPNPKACKYYNFDYDEWVEETKDKISRYTGLPVETRIKGSRSERNKGYTIHDALDSGTYATVAFNSIAALESVLYGVPAFVSVPCAAAPLSSFDLSQLDAPFKPSEELIVKQCRHVAYGQFTIEEIENGTAYELTERYS
jgi:hypothetical protein